MTKGQILYIPAYWWYSIEFGKESSLSTFKYKTYMNTVAILPQLVMRLLQTQNVKRNNMVTVQHISPEKTDMKPAALSELVPASLVPASLVPASLVPESVGSEPFDETLHMETTAL